MKNLTELQKVSLYDRGTSGSKPQEYGTLGTLFEEFVLSSQVIAPSPSTLADLVTSPKIPTIASDSLKILAGTLLVAALSQISVPLPFTPVPMTGQTLGVMLCGMALGTRRGTMALSLYLLGGAVGLPIFAGGGVGVGHLIGPTAGYLWAFPIVGAFVGWLAERHWGKTLLTAALGIAVGSLLLLTLGSLWLSLFVGGLSSGFEKGMFPFLPVEMIKTLLAMGLLPSLWKISEKRKS